MSLSLFFFWMVERFLHFKVGYVPFRYLGILVAANPLSNNYVRFGGRIGLPYYDMNNIFVFYLSFMKMTFQV